MYEQFKNEFVLRLNNVGFDEESIKRIGQQLDLAIYNYDGTRSLK